jgi:hypothetical protein
MLAALLPTARPKATAMPPSGERDPRPRRLMTQRLHREHAAETAMLAYRTGLSAAMCRAWMQAPIVKSADAIKAAFLPDSIDDCIIVARSEIQAYALAQVKCYPRRIMLRKREPLFRATGSFASQDRNEAELMRVANRMLRAARARVLPDHVKLPPPRTSTAGSKNKTTASRKASAAIVTKARGGRHERIHVVRSHWRARQRRTPTVVSADIIR